jgi:ribosome maturation factor RimP
MPRIEPHLKDLGLELVALETPMESGRRILRLLIDRPESPLPEKERPCPGGQNGSNVKEEAKEGHDDREGEAAAEGLGASLGDMGPKGSGVTVKDCASLSRKISLLLDEAFPEDGPDYILEVSSPGLDRPLFGERDLRRFHGFLARLKMEREGRPLKLKGRLDTKGPELFILTQSGAQAFLPEEVMSARLVPEPFPK